MEFLREREMRPVVTAWVSSFGLTPWFETSLSHIVDIMGIRFCQRVGRGIPELERLVAVELKLTDISGVIGQCINNRYFVNASWAAMPDSTVARMRHQSLDKFSEAGIGLVSVGRDVSVVIPAVETQLPQFPRMQSLRRRYWRYLRKDLATNGSA